MKQWFKALFSDSSAVSFGRVAAVIVLFFGLGWATYLIIKKLEIPDLGGVTTLILSVYGTSKVGETIQKFTGNNQ